MVVAAVGMILMLLAALVYAITLVLAYFGFVKGENGGNILATDVSTLLGKYKAMQEEKVITKEEFAQLKAKVFTK